MNKTNTTNIPVQASNQKKESKVIAETIKILWGWDTEYYKNDIAAGSASYYQPVSNQLYLHGYQLSPDRVAELKDPFTCLVHGVKLLDIVAYEHGTCFVFDSRHVESGTGKDSYKFGNYHKDCFRYILDNVVKPVTDGSVKYEHYFFTLYSNAELGLVFPTLNDLRNLMYLNGDEEGSNYKNLKLTPIQKTFSIRNFNYICPSENHRAFVRDVRHIYYHASLDKVAKVVGLSKLEHPDWETTTAAQWLERDRESFINYAATDAMIVCEAALKFYEIEGLLVDDLSKQGVLPDGCDKRVLALKKKLHLTASSVSDDLVKLHLEHQGVWENYKGFTKNLLENYLPLGAQKTKGGLNKYFTSDRPSQIKGVDAFDIKGAYATALEVLEIPLTPPKVITPGKIEWRDIRFWAKTLDDYFPTSLIHLDWVLPEGSNEWERSIVAYDSNGEGCTVRKAESQWITGYELQTLATTSPSAKVRIHQIIYWDSNPNITTNVAEVVNGIKLTRKSWKDEYKRTRDNGAYQIQDTIKLFGNGIVGKFGQATNAYDPDNLHETLMKGGDISNTSHDKVVHSKIYNPFIFNQVTGMVRSIIAVAAWKTKAYMCVTDSLLVNHGSWVNPQEIRTPYKHLNNALKSFEWEMDEGVDAEGNAFPINNVDAIIYKERDYIYYSCHNPEVLKVAVELGDAQLAEAITDIPLKEAVTVHKVAKRGWKAPSGLSNKESNNKFLEQSLPRLEGEPMTFTSKNLVGGKEFLEGEGVLNEEITRESSIGCHNPRHDCDDLTEFKRRKLVKDKCRQHGYADALHCQKNNPELYELIVRRCKPKPQHLPKIPSIVRRAICMLSERLGGLLSYRELERMTGIGKSTIGRWVKELEASLLGGKVWDELKDLENCHHILEDFLKGVKNSGCPI